ncbi:SIMPL domain-containing protein [Candidatus Peribacteria bacterium]|nr:SIMPL domain-containing protein [Candidatus Peribacteria bacterium]
MKDDEKKIRAFLEKNGFTGSTISLNPPTVNKEYNNEYGANGQMTSVFAGYRLSQSVSVESNNIDQIEKVSREASSLIESGVTLSSYTPSYYYTKLSDVKLSLLEKATAQANERAKVLAEKSHTNLLRLKDASMGVFQILGKNSNEDYSEYNFQYRLSRKTSNHNCTELNMLLAQSKNFTKSTSL